mmetsp:Transcript_6128/g.8919  ORF Transcript_6128/g.8919 Transcript_6128/m.8919 type:complete len:106 (+) Transcript_6128:161-478(+)
MVEYTLRKIDNPTDILPLLAEQVDPRPIFTKNEMTKDLSDKEKNSDVLKSIQEQEIKLFVTRKAKLESNMRKVYGLVKSQCSVSLWTVKEIGGVIYLMHYLHLSP